MANVPDHAAMKAAWEARYPVLQAAIAAARPAQEAMTRAESYAWSADVAWRVRGLVERIESEAGETPPLVERALVLSEAWLASTEATLGIDLTDLVVDLAGIVAAVGRQFGEPDRPGMLKCRWGPDGAPSLRMSVDPDYLEMIGVELGTGLWPGSLSGGLCPGCGESESCA